MSNHINPPPRYEVSLDIWGYSNRAHESEGGTGMLRGQLESGANQWGHGSDGSGMLTRTEVPTRRTKDLAKGAQDPKARAHGHPSRTRPLD